MIRVFRRLPPCAAVPSPALRHRLALRLMQLLLVMLLGLGSGVLMAGTLPESGAQARFPTATQDDFGFSVSLAGDRVVVGSYRDDDRGGDSGSVHLFTIDSIPTDPLKINELDYDQPGTDSAEFIELKNSGDSAVSLAAYQLRLINGLNASAYQTFDLPAVELAAGDYYVICSDAAAVDNCDLDVSPDSNLIQNGAPEAVALFNGSALVDSLSYEGDTAAPYTEGTGVTGSANIDSNSIAAVGLSRLPDGADSDDNSADFSRVCITPGASNRSETGDCVDTTPPVIAPSIVGTLGENGWYTSDVSLSWRVTDADSAIRASSGCDAASVTADTTGITYTCEATSAGGTASDSLTIKRDATAPAVIFTTPAHGAVYTLNSVVNADFSGSDATSAIRSLAGAVASGTPFNTADLGTWDFIVTAFDQAGNSTQVTHSYTVVAAPDTSAPVITPSISGTLGDNGWYTGDVSLSWRVIDAESAISASSGCDVSSITSDTAGVTFTCEATSAGGTASDSVTIKRDATAPVIRLSTPADGASYLRGSAVSADWSVSDALSGVASSSGSLASGATIDTSAIAAEDFLVSARDLAGNLASLSHAYNVVAAAADLSISLSDSADPILAGDPLRYTVTVANAGPQTAQQVVVADLLPAGVTLVASSGCAEDPAGLPNCSLGEIAANDSAQFSLSVIVDEAGAGSIANTVSLSSATADPNLANNSASESTLVMPRVLEAQLLVRPVAAGGDDTEELLSGHAAQIESGDLEMTDNDGIDQVVAIRFRDIDIPAGASIDRAWIQFTVDEADSLPSLPSLFSLRGEASDNPAPFSGLYRDVAERPLTAASSSWVPDAWPTVGERGTAQRSSDLAEIVQALVDRPGWQAGNAMVFVIDGVGRRIAESYDANPLDAPALHIEYGILCRPGEPDTDGDGKQDGCDADDDNDGVRDDEDAFPLDPAESVDSDGDGIGNNADPDDDNDGVDDVDDDFPLDPYRSDAGAQSVEARVITSADDAEEVAGRVYLDSSDLDLVEDNGRRRIVGLRFQGVSVPPGVAITSASLQFTAAEVSSGDTELSIRAEAHPNPPAFGWADGNLDNRQRTSAAAVWRPAPWLQADKREAPQRTVDLSPLVQELIGQPGWQAGNAMVFLIEGDGRRVAESFDGSHLGAPTLLIRYSGSDLPRAATPSISPDGGSHVDRVAVSLGCSSPDPGIRYSLDGSHPDPYSTRYESAFELTADATLKAICYSAGHLPSAVAVADFRIDPSPAGSRVFERRVLLPADDAEQRLSTGDSNTLSDDLEMAEDRGRPQLLGLRFSDIQVPRGATITRAWVQFTADEVDAAATALWFRGEASDDAAGFRDRLHDLSERATTEAQVDWSPAAWVAVGDAGEAQRSADLAAVVQEIVSRPGWQPGNALALIVGGSGERVAESRENGGHVAPLLHIEYREAP